MCSARSSVAGGVTDKVGCAGSPLWPTQCTGLLTLAEVDYADGWGDSVLADIRSVKGELRTQGGCGSWA